jgi:sugar/nucleoside kinase (ribokinase family)
MKKIDVITVGSAIKDVMFYSDEVEIINNKKNLTREKLMAFEYGAKLEVDNIFLNYGGGAMNVGVGLRSFGLNVAPLINVGHDMNGQEIFYFLKKMKFNTSLIQIDKKHKTGFSFILTSTKDNEHTIFTYKGATRFLKIPDISKKKVPWYVVSSMSNKSWEKEFAKIVKQVEKTWHDVYEKRVKIAWNPGSVQLKDFEKMRKFLPRVEVLDVNKDEAIGLVMNLYKKSQIDKKKMNQPRYLLDKLRQTGARNVIITASKKGAYAIDSKGKYYYQSSKAKKVVDTVGAGDAFFSGFMAGLIKRNNFDLAMRLGIRNSVAVLREVGAQHGLLKKI